MRSKPYSDNIYNWRSNTISEFKTADWPERGGKTLIGGHTLDMQHALEEYYFCDNLVDWYKNMMSKRVIRKETRIEPNAFDN